MSSKNVANEVVILEKIEGHIKEIKEGILGETPTVKSIPEQLTKLGKGVEETNKEVRRGECTTVIALGLSVALIGFSLLIERSPRIEIEDILSHWEFLMLIFIGVIGAIWAWILRIKFDRPSASNE